MAADAGFFGQAAVANELAAIPLMERFNLTMYYNVESLREGGSPMEQLNLTREEMVNAARDNFANEDLLRRLAAVFPTWRLLAEGQPVSPARIAGVIHKPVDRVRNDLNRVEELGFFSYDEQGNVVDFFGLQLSPTRHRLDIGGQELYAG